MTSKALARTVRRSVPRGKRLSIAIPHIALAVLGLLAMYPFVWLFFASSKSYRELIQSHGLLPHVWTLANYAEILRRANIGNAFANSLVVSVTVTAIVVLTSTGLGYGFAKYRFPGKELLFTLFLSTMMVPGAVTLVPLYITISHLRMVDSLWGIMVPGFWSTFGIFMLRQFMETIPNELIDAARIDGASEPCIFSQIIVPNATAPMAALALFTFLGNWDSYIWPSVVLSDPLKETIPLFLAGLRSILWVRYEIWAAGAMLTIIPVMAIYAYTCRFMIRSVATTGMKM